MSRSERPRENADLIERLRRDGTRIARQFGLSFESIDPERANVKRRYGICYSDGSIRIRLRHVTSGEPLRDSSLVNTLCHELAHLKHFDHGERFERCYLQLLRWARQQGIYRPARRALALPGPQRPPTPAAREPVEASPQQLSLF